MGDPVLIRDFADLLIRFNGFEPDKDIRIEYVGLRAGERLGEKLWSDNETPVPTAFDRILKVEEKEPPRLDLRDLMQKLAPLCRFDSAQPDLFRNSEELRQILKKVISGCSSKMHYEYPQ
jgi:FlaA1/EpsC-like NDP-sugar epimerase